LKGRDLKRGDRKSTVDAIAEQMHWIGSKGGGAEPFLRFERLKLGEIIPDRIDQVRGAPSTELDIRLA